MKSEKQEIESIVEQIFLDLSDSDSLELIEESVTQLLRGGTKFERDVKRIKNQQTFKQYVDSSGLPDAMKQPIYERIPKFRVLADQLSDKSWLWKALYLGLVYQALIDNQKFKDKIS